MAASGNAQLGAGDVVAVHLPPGQLWRDLVDEIWAAEATLFPIDDRMPQPAVARLVERVRPTLIITPSSRTRLRRQASEALPALVVATSGTGGEPKLVELSRPAVVTAAEGTARMLGTDADGPWLSCLPLAHIGGLLVILRSVLVGEPVIIHERFDVDAFAGQQPFSSFATSIVPTMLQRLVESRADLSRFRVILVGGAPLAEDLRERAMVECNATRLVQTYGLTESCGGVVYDGRPFPGTAVRVGGGEELQLRGPTLMTRYLDDPAAQAAAFTREGWLRTGDGGAVSPDGSVTASGRLDDLIVTGGEKVHPERVEAVLRRLPSIADVAVSGRPDAEWGQRVVAFVMPSDRADPPTLDQLRDIVVRGGLPRYEAPRELVLVDDLPRTPSGKVRRSFLP